MTTSTWLRVHATPESRQQMSRARARAKNFAFFYASRERCVSCGARGAFGAARHLEGGGAKAPKRTHDQAG